MIKKFDFEWYYNIVGALYYPQNKAIEEIFQNDFNKLGINISRDICNINISKEKKKSCVCTHISFTNVKSYNLIFECDCGLKWVVYIYP